MLNISTYTLGFLIFTETQKIFGSINKHVLCHLKKWKNIYKFAYLLQDANI